MESSKFMALYKRIWRGNAEGEMSQLTQLLEFIADHFTIFGDNLGEGSALMGNLGQPALLARGSILRQQGLKEPELVEREVNWLLERLKTHSTGDELEDSTLRNAVKPLQEALSEFLTLQPRRTPFVASAERHFSILYGIPARNPETLDKKLQLKLEALRAARDSLYGEHAGEVERERYVKLAHEFRLELEATFSSIAQFLKDPPRTWRETFGELWELENELQLQLLLETEENS